MLPRELTAADFRGYRRTEFPRGSWSVDEDVLHAIAAGPRLDLITRERFADFQFSFEWRLPRGGNSGVLYRVSEDDECAGESGPRMQLLDDEHHPDGVNALTACGALYGLIGAWHDQSRIANVFHRARIVLAGSLAEHWIDDVKVLSYDLASAELRERIQRSRFKDYPRFARTPSGHIALGHNGTDAWFRKLRLEAI